MKRPLAITVWAVLCLLMAAEGVYFAVWPFFSKHHILVMDHATPLSVYVATAALCWLLFTRPRAGVLCGLVMLGSSAIGEAIEVVRFSLFTHEPLATPSEMWMPAVIFVAMAVSTLPFWARTPWSMRSTSAEAGE